MFRRQLTALACTGLIATLTACGGGAERDWGNSGLGATPSSVSQPAEPLPAAGTWEIVSTTDTNAKLGVYHDTYESSNPVEQSDIDVSAGTVSATWSGLRFSPVVWQGDTVMVQAGIKTKVVTVGGVTTVENETDADGNPVYNYVAARDPAAPTLNAAQLWVDANNVQRYTLLMFMVGKAYVCAGPGFSDSDLALLSQSSYGMAVGTNVARCQGTLNIDLTARTYTSNGVNIAELQTDEATGITTSSATSFTRIKVNGGWPEIK